jgi:hypothetical protein
MAVLPFQNMSGDAGSVRRAADRVRITGQLVEAETGRHIWAERYDRAIDDIFALQDEITISVVAAIEPSLRHAGYAAIFPSICQRRNDEVLPESEASVRCRTTSRSIRSSPRRVSRARWSSSARGVLLLHRSPLSMVAPPFKYGRAQPRVPPHLLLPGGWDV